MTRTVNCLEELGLVGREAHESDGRQVVVALTAKAEAVLLAGPAASRRVAQGSPRRAHRFRTAAPAQGRAPARPDVATAVNRTFAALKVRNYRLYATGSLISNVGTWMQRVAQDWLVLALTGSAGALGLTTGLQFLPILLFSPIAGVFADRFSKRTC